MQQIFFVLQSDNELFKNKVNRNMFLTNSWKKQSSPQNQFPELRETVLNVSTTRTNNWQ